MRNFINIKGQRIRLSGIKEYEKLTNTSIKLVYNFSKNKPIKEVFDLDIDENNKVINKLDSVLTDFIKINNTRIKSIGIKTFKPIGEKSLSIGFNFDRNNSQFKIYKFDTVDERDALVEFIEEIY